MCGLAYKLVITRPDGASCISAGCSPATKKAKLSVSSPERAQYLEMYYALSGLGFGVASIAQGCTLRFPLPPFQDVNK